jgi:uncharacterized damage-inducible protein DinB
VPDDLVARLGAAPAAIRRAVDSIDAATAHARPADDAWSVAEIVGHIRAADWIWRTRILHAIVADGVAAPGVDERAVQAAADLSDLSLSEQVRAFTLGRAELVGVLRRLDDATWAHHAVHEQLGSMSVRELCAALSEHEEEHLVQLAEAAATARDGSEPATEKAALSLGERVMGEILDRSHRLRPDEIPTVVDRAVVALGARSASILVVDMEQRVLVRLDDRAMGVEELAVDGTIAGRVFRTGEPHETSTDLWLPLLDGADRVGVLQVTLSADADETLRHRLSRLASITALLIVTKSAFGDAIVVARRVKPMALAAELRWSNLPPLSFRNDLVELACMLEPAYEVAGDGFDYGLAHDVADAAIFDAMGHGLAATRMANLAMAVYRYARRMGNEIADIARLIDAVLRSAIGPEQFVTGLLLRVDLTTGMVQLISAGHPMPLLLRGRQLITQVEAPVGPPLGVGLGRLTVGELALEAGDRLLLFTDGVTEAQAADGTFFGVERLGELLTHAAMAGDTAPETVRRLTHDVLTHAVELRDDATLLLLGWRP